MAPKKKVEEAPPVEEQEPEEPEPPELFKKCFRAAGQLFYGDCKAGGKDRPGSFVRHGFGRQVDLAVTPAGRRFSDEIAYETVVAGIYEGNFDEDVMSGQGTYKWSDGASYEGHFVEGQPSGHGRFAWPDGSAYEGSFIGGCMGGGQGRLDSRFDGKFHQGKFHRNCFQQTSGRWVEVLEKVRREESHRVMAGDGAAAKVVRCAFGECYRQGASQATMDAEKESLVNALEQIQAENLVPFVVAEAGLGGSPLDCLAAASLVDAESQAVSVRLAAIAARRRRDCHRFFHDAIQASLRRGSLFVVAFEDDDEGCGMFQEEQEDWHKRLTSPDVPQLLIPDDWQLHNFFLPASFPVEVFQPSLFNGRHLVRHFLPEAAQRPRPACPPRPDDAGEAAAAAPAETGEEVDGDASAEVAGEAAAAQAAKRAAVRKLVEKAAAGATGGIVGQTGHFFEAGELRPEDAGLPLTHCLRPAVCALGRLPEGLTDEEVKSAVAVRFGEHVPLHRAAVLVLGERAEVPETLA